MIERGGGVVVCLGLCGFVVYLYGVGGWEGDRFGREIDRFWDGEEVDE